LRAPNQTTQLFGDLTVLENVLIAHRQGQLGLLLTPLGGGEAEALARDLLSFVGYRGGLNRKAGDLPHVDKRLVEIARALATRPKALLLDEPAAGLMRDDKERPGQPAAAHRRKWHRSGPR
jgi:branched-chain amino acid transport system ATP-binding protein